LSHYNTVILVEAWRRVVGWDGAFNPLAGGADGFFQREAIRVNAAFSLGSVGRAVLLCTLLFGLLLQAGCDTSGAYPSDLTYQLREDLLVITAPKDEALYPIPPGKLNESIKAIDEKGGKTLDPKDLESKDRDGLVQALLKTFGTPAGPMVKIKGEDEAFDKQKKDLKLDDATLEAGSKLYRRHCLQCHGVDGDGRGPTGPWVSPPPRDYRRGVFKFTSTDTAQFSKSNLNKAPKPSRNDLHRTLHNGLEGTSMPSFALLKEDELQQLVSYVMHLSIRGLCEYDAMYRLLTKQELEDNSIAKQVEASLAEQMEAWYKANQPKTLITPDPKTLPSYSENDKTKREEAVRKGYALFIDTKGKAACSSCHTDFGRQAPYKYDDWGTLTRPMNLTTGVYRGGRRPIDLFWRVRSGVKPLMPENLEMNTKLTDEELWQVVAFIQALPYPAMLPEDLRKTIYGSNVAGSD
jgi:mono/diheme cytochrome c family protein